MPGGSSAEPFPSPEVETTVVALGLRPSSWSQPRWRWPRVVLLVVGTLLLVAVPLLGERASSVDDTRTAIASGEIETVQLRLDGGNGSVVRPVAVAWRSGWVTHVAMVDDATAAAIDDFGPPVGTDAAGVPAGRVEVVRRFTAWVHGLDQGVGVTTVDLDGLQHGTVDDWNVPAWLLLAAVLWSLGALALLVSGPEPRRATRWAWFWIFSVVPPLGVGAYLLLGARAESPTDDGQTGSTRHTGGWAFIWTSVVSTIVTNAF